MSPHAIPSIKDWEAEVVAFLSAHGHEVTPTGFAWGEGRDRASLIPDSHRDDVSVIEAEKAWRAIAFDAGFAWPEGPEEFGGRGFPQEFRYAYDRLEGEYDVPGSKHIGIGVRIVAPTILKWAQADLRARIPRALQRGELVACQLFSEPSAGSDLASLRTRARREGDHWVVTGQKVWTSEAHWADVGLLAARTDPDVPKHSGITAFAIDMHSPGVEVRPLRQMTGGAGFNEVFLDEVRVPDSARLGEVGQGWQVITSNLAGERGSIGGGVGLAMLQPARLMAAARAVGRDQDPLLRQQIADIAIRARSAEEVQALLMEENAGVAGPELSAAKLLATDVLTRAQSLLTALLGPRLTADTGEWGTFSWSEWVLGVPGIRFGGGTDEIQRNVLADRVLGLPRA